MVSKVQDDVVHGQRRARPGPPLLTFPVLISVTNYATLTLLYFTIASEVLPLFLAMPIELGGLGLPPSKIGLILSSYGAATALQVFFCAKLIQRFGSTRLFIAGMSTCLPIFALFPLTSIVAQRTGLTLVIWSLLACILVLGALLDTFGTRDLYVSDRVGTNSLAKTIGPALAMSLFSLSLENNLLGGYAVYAVLLCLSSLALLLATRLPPEMWEEVED
ncbi:hypothetical protein B0H17DRAFT_1197300 [Mycena rosella]|uniref:MFS transporter n=1 Tax=Mycena rosella TaxID=1033263 RepID=A0AAD7GJG7_MYCRO|nr:hypothetical protein B0H17DRAFT_1197300 [Mycena rosella]